MIKSFFSTSAPISKGFTLVETLIAIAVLSLAVTGPMTIAQKSISSAIYARDQVTAYYLAQDAIEYVRNVRDSNRLKNNNGGTVNWLDGLTDCFDTNGCVINTNIPSSDSDAVEIAGMSNEKMYFDKDYFLYSHQNHSSSILTHFSRRVRVNEAVPGREADITVTISWKTNAFSPLKDFKASERIFNF